MSVQNTHTSFSETLIKGVLIMKGAFDEWRRARRAMSLQDTHTNGEILIALQNK